jgi:hypothetical protein
MSATSRVDSHLDSGGIDLEASGTGARALQDSTPFPEVENNWRVADEVSWL